MSKSEPRSRTAAGASGTRPRNHAMSPANLARIFYQPSVIYFNAAAECLSIRGAGRRLNIASSAVTRQIAQLEDALGLELFERDRRELKLTPAGQVLHRHIRRLSIPLEAAVSELDMLRGLKTGTVHVVTVESVGISFLPQLITDFRQLYPRLQVDVSVVSSAEVIARLADERADVGFGFVARPSEHVEIAARRDVRIGVVMSPDHPLMKVPTLTLADCIAFPMAVAKPEISIRDVIEPFLQRSALNLPSLVEVDSIRMLVELALIGGYASVMTPIGAQNELRSGALRFRALEDPDLPTNRFGLMVRARSTQQFAAAVFYDHAMQHFGSLELPGEIQPE
ncbi:LysR family transcriptional regulator [Labrys sp. LIt4]|uniref:LysR family transcriptional regulator n=1 Tax=Labrys sp. LIt4 TaxID=2821355 RepID=UPI001AE00AF2|nr:LysR family transcriptional regulator [Labrys sp. LIt4]MBP0583408.1 LysR family transcriptional regulator [Labrys sp. LIt4]